MVLALALLAAVGAARGEAGYRAGYDLHLGGFRVGELQSDLSLDQRSYSMSLALQSRGVAGWLVDLRTDAVAEGAIEDGRLVPRHYRADTRRNREQRSNRLWFDRDGRVAQLEIRPGPDHEPVPKELQRAPGPVSAMLARPGADQMQRCPALLAVEGAARGLAVDRDHALDPPRRFGQVAGALERIQGGQTQPSQQPRDFSARPARATPAPAAGARPGATSSWLPAAAPRR